MKTCCFFLILSTCITLVSCLRDYDVAEFHITNFDLQTASTETNTGLPAACNDTANKHLFALQLNFTMDDNLDEIDFNAAESYAVNTNPLDCVLVWSNTIFSGIPPGTPINNRFYVFKDSYASSYRLNDGDGIELSNEYTKPPYHHQIHFICDQEIVEGNYKFYTQLFLKDGTSFIDSTNQIYLE